MGSPGEVVVRFHAGTVEVRGLAERSALALPQARWDERSACFRAPASAYAAIFLALRDAGVAARDEARGYEELAMGALARHEPRPYQREALAAWTKNTGRGVVVLPTGAGKSHLAVLAIDTRRRSTLVVAPTLDLVRQWYDLLRAAFRTEIGVIGGGEHRVLPLSVTTYDSAYLHMEHLGAKFGMLVFDECHHLPGPSYALAAQLAIAPFRLGLTATPERVDGRDGLLESLIGPTVYRKDIVELAGEFLAEYDTERVVVQLSPEERAEHDRERGVYLDFIRSRRIRVSEPQGWSLFIILSARDEDGRRAMRAYRRQRELAFGADAKIDYVDHLLHRHRADRAILFTQDNATCYLLSRRFLIPAITHQTKVKERSEILGGLREGRYGAVVTSKVLNEGVDVPEANVAIVVSGSGSVREHVQRLGRILRKQGDKRAVLYEIVAADTAETFTSKRRREHVAYR